MTDTAPDTAPALLETEEALRAWIDGHPQRHAATDDGLCACGWPHVPTEMIEAFQKSQGSTFPTQAQHAEAVLISGLGDLLPSDTSNVMASGPQPVAWRPLVKSLYEQIDRHDSEIDPRLLQLMRFCLDQGHDVLTLANVTVMHPNYLSRVLGVGLPAPDTEPGANLPMDQVPEPEASPAS